MLAPTQVPTLSQIDERERILEGLTELLSATRAIDLDEYCRLEQIDRVLLDELVQEMIERKFARLSFELTEKPILRADVAFFMQLEPRQKYTALKRIYAEEDYKPMVKLLRKRQWIQYDKENNLILKNESVLSDEQLGLLYNFEQGIATDEETQLLFDHGLLDTEQIETPILILNQ